MAYDRYDGRDQARGDREGRQQGHGGERDQRGFFERARDEVSSWFGDESGEGRRMHDDRMSHPSSSRGQESAEFNQRRGYDDPYTGSNRGYEPQAYDRQRRGQEDDRFGNSDRSAFFGGGQSSSYGRGRDEGDYRNQYGRGGGESGGFGRGDYGHQGEQFYGRQGQDYGNLGSGRSYPSGYGQTGGGSYRESQHQSFGGREEGRQGGSFQSQGSERYRPMTGDYGRGSSGGSQDGGRSYSGMGGQDFHSQQYGRQDFSQDQDRDRTYNFGGWGDQDSRRQSGQQGSSSSFGGARSVHDDHYHSWRQRQIEELDRDYDEYRREHQSRFEQEFSGFRQQRQTKRQMLNSIREHMEVVDESGQHIGTVDKVRGDTVILTRNDPEAGGVHRSFSCSLLERVEDNKVFLSGTKETIRSRLREEREEERGGSGGGGMFGSFFGGGSSDQSQDRQSQSASAQATTTSSTTGTSGRSGDGPHVLDQSFSGTYDDEDSSTRR
jgi:hypothetical protein